MTTTTPNLPSTLDSQPETPNQPQQQQQQQQVMEEHKQEQPLQQLQQPPLTPHTPQTLPQSPPPVGPLQPLTPNTRLPPKPASPPSPTAGPSVTSPGKRDLKSWWKSFKLQSKSQETTRAQDEPRIFGVPLRQSISYANVAISLVDQNGESYVFGYVPIVVAKCGVFLKEKATHVEGIFRLSGSEKRIKQLKTAFNTPDRYGKGLSWDGYTVHDASNVLRRYLNDLPEPVVPLAFYERFRDPLRNATIPGASDSDGPRLIRGFDVQAAIAKYQDLVMELPPLNRQLLLYLLDLLSVFASLAEKNRMTSQNLAAIFQPGILSHPAHAMAPEEYRLNQTVLVFLIEHQDYFIVIGKKAADADRHVAQEIQKGSPPRTPGIATELIGSSVIRTASNASAGADSVARDGKIRRNRSTTSRHSLHSRHSRHSNANSVCNTPVEHCSPSPGSHSPAPATPPASSPGALSRSNTMPSRSPGFASGRFVKRTDGSPVSPLTPIHPQHPPSAQATPSVSPVAEVLTPIEDISSLDPLAAAVAAPQADLTHGAGAGPATPEKPAGGSVADDAGTPTKRFHIFLRSSANDSNSELRPQPNKLKKKRGPGSTNPSAQSSTVSFRSSSANDHPVELHVRGDGPFGDTHLAPDDAPPQKGSNGVPTPRSEEESKLTPHVSQAPSTETTATAIPTSMADIATGTVADAAHLSDTPYSPKKTPTSTSLHSSFNEESNLGEAHETAAVSAPEAPVEEQPEKEKKRRWRLSRRRDDMLAVSVPVQPVMSHQSTSNVSAVSTPPGPGSSVGSNGHAGLSTSSIGSGGPSLAGVGTTSLTGASGSSDSAFASNGETHVAIEHADEAGKKKLSGWLKSKVRGNKDSGDHHKRALSPAPVDQRPSFEVQEQNLESTRAAEKARDPVS